MFKQKSKIIKINKVYYSRNLYTFHLNHAELLEKPLTARN
ncbi:hypothetical protein J579_2712 [Acinetobacter sp. 1239920]|nr:hypothetical protein J579_2712 [Acinetobacter sp. 1239920]